MANTVTESCAKLADAAGQLARGAMSPGDIGCVRYRMRPGTALEVSWRRYEKSAAGVQELMFNNARRSTIARASRLFTQPCRRSRRAGRGSLRQLERIRPTRICGLLDYGPSPNGHATRSFTATRSEATMAPNGARAIVTAVAENQALRPPLLS